MKLSAISHLIEDHKPIVIGAALKIVVAQAQSTEPLGPRQKADLAGSPTFWANNSEDVLDLADQLAEAWAA